MVSNRSMPALLGAGKQYKGFPLEVPCAGIKILPDGHEIVLNTESGHYTILNWDMRYLVADGCFTQDELRFMAVLLNRWPSYVPNEKLLQSVTQQETEQINLLLDTQREETLVALHALAENCSQHLRSYGIDIQMVGTFGYKLSRVVVEETQAQSNHQAGRTATHADYV